MTINAIYQSPPNLRRLGDISVLDAISILERPDAVLIDVSGEGSSDLEADFVERLATAVPDRSRLVVVIDEDGSKSQQAADAAAASGYGRVLNVADGYRGLGDACPSLLPGGYAITQATRP